jgi:uncharacterized protein
MDSERNKNLVVAAWKAFASRDPQRVSDVFTVDAEWLAPAGNATASALNGTNHMVGREALVQFLTSDFHKLFQRDVKIEFRGIYADGNTVIVEERMQAKLANGRHYDNDYCLLFELKDGRIRRVREYMDTQRAREIILG